MDFETGLGRNPANFQPLTPLQFLERAAATFPDRTAVIHGPLRRPYAELYARSRRLAAIAVLYSFSRLKIASGMACATSMIRRHQPGT